MNHELNDQLDPAANVEIEETEMDSIANALQVRTGVRAGLKIQPCI